MSKYEELKQHETALKVNNVTAAQLRRKLQDGTAKKDDVPLAHQYAKMMANAESIALYTSIKRQAQENEE